MEIVEEMIGQERRTGMGRTVRARGLYRRIQSSESRIQSPELGTKDEGRGRGKGEVEVKVEREEGRRSMWVECRECERRERVPSMNRGELVRAIDAGELRCSECGGRMVEG